jgi:hypothetical protein
MIPIDFQSLPEPLKALFLESNAVSLLQIEGQIVAVPIALPQVPPRKHKRKDTKVRVRTVTRMTKNEAK